MYFTDSVNGASWRFQWSGPKIFYFIVVRMYSFCSETDHQNHCTGQGPARAATGLGEDFLKYRFVIQWRETWYKLVSKSEVTRYSKFKPLWLLLFITLWLVYCFERPLSVWFCAFLLTWLHRLHFFNFYLIILNVGIEQCTLSFLDFSSNLIKLITAYFPCLVSIIFSAKHSTLLHI